MTDEKDNKIKDLEAKNNEKEKTINTLNTSIKEKDNKINDLESKNKEKENQLNTLNSNIKEKDNKIKDLEAKNKEKENTISTLNTSIQGKDNKIKELEAKNKENENTINALNSNIKEKDKKIQDLEAKNKEKDNNINTLNTKVKEIEQLNSKLNEKENKIKELEGKIKEKETSENCKIKEINNLENKVKITEGENKSLKDELNKHKNKIKELDEKISKLQNEIKDNKAVKELTQENENLKSQNELLNSILIPRINSDTKNSYDISLNFTSIKSIKEGWDLILSETGLQNFNKKIKCQKIGILGNKGVGKSFILSRLFGIPFIKSAMDSQEKINIKLKLKKKNKKEKEVKFMIFDCQGFDSPILEEKIINTEEYNNSEIINSNNDKEEEKKAENINNNENQNINLTNSAESIKNVFNNSSILNLEDNDELQKYIKIEELKTNKYLIEEFITRFIIDYSDIIILVVDILKYSDQLLLDKIIKECIIHKKGSLYVIHNLKNLTTKEQVDKYIKNILKKSGTFDLEEKKFNDFSDSENEEEENKETVEENNEQPAYYTMKYDSLNINHFIFINDICNEKSYNKFTKEKMEFFVNISPRTDFNISKKLHNKIFDLLKDYSRNEIKPEEIKLEENESNKDTKKIIYKGDENIKLKKYIKNNSNNIKNELNLKYSYYSSINEEEKKLYILIERPGEITDQHIYGRKDKMKYNIKYTGKKCLSEEEKQQKGNTKIVGREFGEFILDIDIDLKDYEISNLEKPEFKEKNGIGYIIYNLKNISNLDFTINTEEKKENNSK